jgi:hypothetical protein
MEFADVEAGAKRDCPILSLRTGGEAHRAAAAHHRIERDLESGVQLTQFERRCDRLIALTGDRPRNSIVAQSLAVHSYSAHSLRIWLELNTEMILPDPQELL